MYILLGWVAMCTGWETSRQPQHLRVCTVIDDGFNVLKPGLANQGITEAEVTSDDQLIGFDVDARKHLLGLIAVDVPLSYSVRLYPSYTSLHVAVRTAACDVGWAPFFMTGSRDSCRPSPSCKTLDELAQEEGPDLEPWRCCIDFLAPYEKFGTAVMYTTKQMTFWEALLKALTGAFVINMLCYWSSPSSSRISCGSRSARRTVSTSRGDTWKA